MQVLSEDRPVVGLKREDFLVWDEREPQTITDLWSEDQVLDIMLVLDVSISTLPVRDKIRSAAFEATSHLDFRDRVGVVMFGAQSYLVIEPTWDWGRVDEEIRRDSLGAEEHRAEHAGTLHGALSQALCPPGGAASHRHSHRQQGLPGSF